MRIGVNLGLIYVLNILEISLGGNFDFHKRRSILEPKLLITEYLKQSANDPCRLLLPNRPEPTETASAF